MGWACGDARNHTRFWWETLLERGQLRRWKDNIKLDLIEMGDRRK
jgi:hypothetical protein